MKPLNYKDVEENIISFLKKHAQDAQKKGYVVGVSGGVDSAVVSTLAAKSGLKLYLIQMPIRQKSDEVGRAELHIDWLTNKFSNVSSLTCDLTPTFDCMISSFEKHEDKEHQHMTEANTRARLRMTTLYYYASIKDCLVLGTGNKVEDYGIGFFTKYGDGGVDISPIGDLLKSEVRELGRYMGVSNVIIEAKPTDGLWDDGRGDEDQIGATYNELEWAMEFLSSKNYNESSMLSKRQKDVLEIFIKRNVANKHKNCMPPVCEIKR